MSMCKQHTTRGCPALTVYPPQRAWEVGRVRLASHKQASWLAEMHHGPRLPPIRLSRLRTSTQLLHLHFSSVWKELVHHNFPNCQLSFCMTGHSGHTDPIRPPPRSADMLPEQTWTKLMLGSPGLLPGREVRHQSLGCSCELNCDPPKIHMLKS